MQLSLLMLILLGSASSYENYSSPFLNVLVHPNNNSVVSLAANEHLKAEFHFLGNPGAEDLFRYTICVSYSTGRPTCNLGFITKINTTVTFDPPQHYQISYLTNANNQYKIFLVWLSNVENKEVDKVRVRVDYSYVDGDGERDALTFIVDVWMDHTQEQRGSETTTKISGATEALERMDEAGTISVGVVLGIVCSGLALGWLLTAIFCYLKLKRPRVSPVAATNPLAVSEDPEAMEIHTAQAPHAMVRDTRDTVSSDSGNSSLQLANPAPPP